VDGTNGSTFSNSDNGKQYSSCGQTAKSAATTGQEGNGIQARNDTQHVWQIIRDVSAWLSGATHKESTLFGRRVRPQ
jgi:hypothetical protein